MRKYIAYYWGFIMKGVILGTTAGALISAIVFSADSRSSKRFKNRIFKRANKFIKMGMKTKFHIMRKMARIIYKFA